MVEWAAYVGRCIACDEQVDAATQGHEWRNGEPLHVYCQPAYDNAEDDNADQIH